MMCYSLFWLCLVIPISVKTLVTPSIVNVTGEYYITSQSGSFANDNISCTSTSCFIICDNPQNCSSTTIDAGQPVSLTLQCTANRSCHNTKLLQGPSTSINILCLNDAACDQAIFNMQNTEDVEITCYNINCQRNCGTESGSCRSAYFNAENATNVDINCLDQYDCWSATFNVQYTDITYVNAQYYGMHTGFIIGTFINTELTVNCTGNSACRQSDIRCPISADCNLYCQDESANIAVCRDMDIFLQTVDTRLNLLCGTKGGNCKNVDLHCEDTNLITNFLWVGPGSYECLELDKCCPDSLRAPIKIIECYENEDCFVNCTAVDCSYKTIINGSLALSLTITCNNNYECTYADVYCPMNGHCIFNCLDFYSCTSIELIPETVKSLTMNCIGQGSCRSMDIIDVVVSQTVDIRCLGKLSCQWVDFTLQINGAYFKLECIDGDYACRNMDVVIDGNKDKTDIIITATADTTLWRTSTEINKARSLTIHCIADADRPCWNFEVTALEMNEINILCKDLKSCSQSKWILNANDILFRCHGDLSCEQSTITVNVSNSISITTTHETALSETVTSVFCWDCMNIYNCMNNITFHCGFDRIPFSINNDDQCKNCMCDNQQPNIAHIIPFIDNIWQQCIPTPKPTVDPTNIPTFIPTFIPTSNPTNIPTSNPTNIPTSIPTFDPTQNPSIEPTFIPTLTPTFDPTKNPTKYPTPDPTPHEAGIVELIITTTDTQLTQAKDSKLNQKGFNHKYMSIILIIVIIFIVLIIIVAIFVVYRKKQKRNQIEQQKKMINANIVSEMTTNTNGVKIDVDIEKELNNEILSDVNNVTKGDNEFEDEMMRQIVNSDTDGFIVKGEDEITAGNIVCDNNESTGEDDDNSDNTQEITSGNIDDEYMLSHLDDVTVQ